MSTGIIIFYCIILIWITYTTFYSISSISDPNIEPLENQPDTWYAADYSGVTLGTASSMLECRLLEGEPFGTYWLYLNLNDAKMTIPVHYDNNKDRYVGVIADLPLVAKYTSNKQGLTLKLGYLNPIIFSKNIKTYVRKIIYDSTKIDSHIWSTQDTHNEDRKNMSYTFYRASDQLLMLNTPDRSTFVMQLPEGRYAELDHKGKIVNYYILSNNHSAGNELKAQYFDGTDILV
jgi:hypothetical protein